MHPLKFPPRLKTPLSNADWVRLVGGNSWCSDFQVPCAFKRGRCFICDAGSSQTEMSHMEVRNLGHIQDLSEFLLFTTLKKEIFFSEKQHILDDHSKIYFGKMYLLLAFKKMLIILRYLPCVHRWFDCVCFLISGGFWLASNSRGSYRKLAFSVSARNVFYLMMCQIPLRKHSCYS